ncbi:hypothetical protein B0H65DRAFT_567150 [Neurospora tetraspora]|uniref:EF-hand n=1 Tax=Neurospora tetraspora TaxID=94610 RepID=A0AAE0MV17_9PEZI|nr:hypothetical protein B0H65DRAFT_567150 [Neurospora tetraspora]
MSELPFRGSKGSVSTSSGLLILGRAAAKGNLQNPTCPNKAIPPYRIPPFLELWRLSSDSRGFLFGFFSRLFILIIPDNQFRRTSTETNDQLFERTVIGYFTPPLRLPATFSRARLQAGARKGAIHIRTPASAWGVRERREEGFPAPEARSEAIEVVIRQNSFKIDKTSSSTPWLMRGSHAPPHDDYHKIKREQYSILFSVADRANKGKVTLSDWTYFENLLEKPDAECCPPVVTTKWTSYENLLEKPDAEYEIAFRLFDVERLGTAKYDDFRRLYELNKGPDSIPFDGTANVRAFQNMIEEMDLASQGSLVEVIIRKACDKSQDGKITRTEFLNQASKFTRFSLFIPMEAGGGRGRRKRSKIVSREGRPKRTKLLGLSQSQAAQEVLPEDFPSWAVLKEIVV